MTGSARASARPSDTSDRDVRIGPTAHYTAHVWERLGMPHAELFGTPQGRRLYWTLRLGLEWPLLLGGTVPLLAQVLELRHRTIDAALERGGAAGVDGPAGIDRFVELGAGLSRRGISFAARGVRVVEVDLPHMVEHKQTLIAQRAGVALRDRVASTLRHQAHDVLSPDLPGFLAEALRGAVRPAVVAEGLLGYFQLDERRALVRSIRAGLAGAGGGIFLCDLRFREGGVATGLAVRGLRGAIRLATRGRGAGPDHESLEDARRLFLDAGFDSAEPLDLSLVPHLAHLRVPVRVWRAEVAASARRAADAGIRQ